MREASTPLDVFDDPNPGRIGLAKWILPVILLVLVPILVAVAVFSRQPPSVWSATDIVLFVLTALLCTLVAVSLALTGCGEWLNRIEQSIQPVATQLNAIQEAQTRLSDTVQKSSLELATRTLQDEANPRLLQDGVTRLADSLQTVMSNIAALSKAVQAQREATDAGLAALGTGHKELATDIQKLQQLTQTASESALNSAREQAAAHDSLQDSGRSLTTATEALQQDQQTLQTKVEELAEAGKQTGAAVAALALEQTALHETARHLGELTQTVADRVADAAHEQAAAYSALQDGDQVRTGAIETIQQSQQTLQTKVEALVEAGKQTVAGVASMAAERTALSETLQAHEETIDAAVAAWSTGHEQLANEVRQLQALTQTVAGGVTDVAREQAAAHGSLQDSARIVTAATEAIEQSQRTLRAEVEKMAETARQTIAAVTALAAEQTTGREVTRHMIGEVANAAIAALTTGYGRLTRDVQQLQVLAQTAVDSCPLDVRQAIPTEEAGGSLRLPAAQAVTHGEQIRYEVGPDRDNLGYWSNASDWAQWELDVPRPGRFKVMAEIAAVACGRFQVLIGNQGVEGNTPNTGDYGRFQTVELGTLELTSPGKTSVAVRPIPEGWQPMNLRSLDLVPLA